MSRIFRGLGPSLPTSNRLALSILAVAAAVVLVSCGHAGTSPKATRATTTSPAMSSAATGIVTGLIRFGGGPLFTDKHGHRTHDTLAGTVTVFTATGRPLAHAYVHKAQRFSFTLPVGRYQLNAGSRLFDPHQACRAVTASVQPAHTTHVDVYAGCSIP